MGSAGLRRQGASLLALLAAASLLLGFGLSRLAPALFALPLYWAPLAALALATGTMLVVLARRGRLLEPLSVITFFTALAFVVRPLHLALSRGELLDVTPRGAGGDLSRRLTDLRAQEITQYVQTKLVGGFDQAFTRTLLACLLFFVALLLGYRAHLAQRLAARVARLRSSAVLDMRIVIGAFIAVGLAGQVAILAAIGGLGAAAQDLEGQATLKVGFVYYVAASFLPVALLLWACWHPPWGTPLRIPLLLVLAEAVLFYGLTGSRERMLISVAPVLLARHYLYRPMATRRLVLLGCLGVVLFSAFVAIRHSTASTSFGEALRTAPQLGLSGRTVLNEDTRFDILFQATDYFGSAAPYRHGRDLTDSALAYVPGFLYPGRPRPTDIWFRQLIWGDRLGAGRPFSGIGDFYVDFGWVGVILGSFLVGVLARTLTGLVRKRSPDLRSPYQVGVFIICTLVLVDFVVNGYSVAIGHGIELAFPFVLAAHLLSRRVVRWRTS
jgi:hypothetical protein